MQIILIAHLQVISNLKPAQFPTCFLIFLDANPLFEGRAPSRLLPEAWRRWGTNSRSLGQTSVAPIRKTRKHREWTPLVTSKEEVDEGI